MKRRIKNALTDIAVSAERETGNTGNLSMESIAQVEGKSKGGEVK